jgi:AcrR family transcriptional regulator
MIHEAFIYSGEDEYAEVLAPFLREAVVAGGRAVAVTTPERIRLLREALGAEHEAVSFFDSDDWYSRPGATLARWRFELEGDDDAEAIRLVGEVPFAGDDDARWARYESLFNRAFSQHAAWVVCPYDARRLPDKVLADARRTHPVVSTGLGRAPSPEHFSGHELGASLSPGVDRAGASIGAATTVAAGSDPADLRRAVTWPARAAGIQGAALEDLILSISEIARAFATATIRTGRAGGEWFCEVAGTGRAPGGLPFDENGLGIVIARLICDSVEIDYTDGLLVRLVFGTPKASARDRILNAAAVLFAENGVRATSVNTIIEHAGVAKATFYAYFPAKNDLVLAWLQTAPVRWFEGLRAEVEARAASPAERLTLLFDVLGEWLEAGDFHCATLDTASEVRSSDPARHALAELHGEIEEYLRSTATAAGLRDPDVLASQLLVLVMGTITTATARRSADPVAAARLAAIGLLVSAGEGRARADDGTRTHDLLHGKQTL